MTDRPSKLQRLRLKKGLSLPQAARLLGVSVAALHSWEHGLRIPGGKSLCLLADFYGLPESVILRDVQRSRERRTAGQKARESA